MHDDGPVVGPRVLPHAPLQHVEHDVETEIAVHVDVQLVAGVPVEPGALLQVLGRHEPVALVTVGVAAVHLQELRDDCAVAKSLICPGRNETFPRGALRDLPLGVGERRGEPQPRSTWDLPSTTK